MTRPPFAATAGLVLTLAVVLAYEITAPGSVPESEMAISAVAPLKAADTGADAAVGQWSSIVLARPLFRADRRPVPAAGVSVSITLPRLSAIIVTRTSRSAIFAGDGSKPVIVFEGGRLGLYQLRRISPDSVTLVGPNGPVTLRPQFSTAAPSGQDGVFPDHRFSNGPF